MLPIGVLTLSSLCLLAYCQLCDVGHLSVRGLEIGPSSPASLGREAIRLVASIFFPVRFFASSASGRRHDRHGGPRKLSDGVADFLFQASLCLPSTASCIGNDWHWHRHALTPISVGAVGPGRGCAGISQPPF